MQIDNMLVPKPNRKYLSQNHEKNVKDNNIPSSCYGRENFMFVCLGAVCVDYLKSHFKLRTLYITFGLV